MRLRSSAVAGIAASRAVEVVDAGVGDLVVGEHGLDQLLDGLLGVEADDHVREGGIEADVVEHDAMGSRFPQEELCVGAGFVGRG